MIKTNVFMTLERARGMVWQATGKLAGDLFDSGDLTRETLKTASKHGETEQIRAAAQALYDEKIRQIDAYLATGAPPRNLDEALSVKWPLEGSNFGKPIGELDYHEQITAADLGWAMTSAGDEQTRAAARILLSSKLAVETEKSRGRGQLKVTIPKRNYLVSQRESIIARKNFREGIDISVSIAIILVCIAIEICFLPKMLSQDLSQLLPGAALTLALFCLFLYFVLMPFVKKHVDDKYTEDDRQIENYRKGLHGEELVTEALREALDGDSHLFRNVKLPNRKSDIDMVLVTPQGVYAIEVKTWAGEFEIKGKDWLTKDGEKWVNHYKRQGKNSKGKLSPIAQAKENAKVLNNSFLKKQLHLKNEWVTAVLAPAMSKMIVRETEPRNIEVWRLGEIKAKLQNRPQERKIPEAEQALIEAELLKLYDLETPDPAKVGSKRLIWKLSRFWRRLPQ